MRTNHSWSANGAILTIDQVNKTFEIKGKPPVQALDHVSFNVSGGQVTGLVGADGAGKTTLIRIAVGLLTPSSGKATVLGFDSVNDNLEIQSRVGYMPQKFGLYQDLTVMENLQLYADLQGVPGVERKSRYTSLLEMTDMDRFTKRRAGALSGGMKQKLGLACALIKSPELLLLDEPTVGVDPVSRRELWKIVYHLVETDKIGVLVSTAYLDEAEQCAEVMVMDHGKLLAKGTPKQFTANMEGKVYWAEPNKQIRARQIYTRLAGRKGIVDTTIRSGRVRIVTDTPYNHDNIYDAFNESIQIRSATPCFEDAFMELIPQEHEPFTFHQAEVSPSSNEEKNKKHADNTCNTVLVSTDQLYKKFGDFEAVKDLSFVVNRGEIFGLLGPNGAGKSTTFRMLCGLLPATSGDIRVAGKDLRKSRAKARSLLGYMAQQFSLYGQLSVLENLRFFGKAYGLYGKHLQSRIEWAFMEFGLGDWKDKHAGDLPGGYKQRLAMAAALLHEPEILFLDEPTSGVDPFARREFWLRINSFAQQGVTVVVTTHFMEEAEYCNRMLIMRSGELLAMGTPTEIRNMARTQENPEPSMDDAFITLAESKGASNQSSTIAGGVQ